MRAYRRLPPIAMACLLLAAPQARAQQPGDTPAQRARFIAVLPFSQDFTDPPGTDEPYGLRVAVAIAAKWERVDGYEAVDRFAVADAMRAEHLTIASAELPPERLARLAQTLAADCVVYGSARGSGAAKQLTVRIYEADRGATLLDRQYQLSYWTDLRFALEDVVAAVTGHVFMRPNEDLAILDPDSLAAWQANPNLIRNGDFAAGENGQLTGWEAVIQDRRYAPPRTEDVAAPLQEDRDRMVLWSPAPDAPGTRVLQFAMPESVAVMHGLACYSEWIEVEPGARYRVSVTYRSDGPMMLNFVKGYAIVDAGDGLGPQRREVYRRQFPKLGPTQGRWETVVLDFTPGVVSPGRSERPPYELRWIRVDLYGYYPQGRLYFRDVTLKIVERPGPGRRAQDPVAPVPAPRPNDPAPQGGGS